MSPSLSGPEAQALSRRMEFDERQGARAASPIHGAGMEGRGRKKPSCHSLDPGTPWPVARLCRWGRSPLSHQAAALGMHEKGFCTVPQEGQGCPAS